MALRDIFIVVSIAVYFFFLTTFLTFLQADTSLAELGDYETGNQSYDINVNTSNINMTSGASDIESPLSIIQMLVRMFTWRIPESLVPSWLEFIIVFINWLFLIVLGFSIYKMLSPVTGGH